jgi:hypothetical protein
MITGMKLETRLPSETKSQQVHLREQGFCIARDIIQTATSVDLPADVDPDFKRTPFCEAASIPHE